MEDRRAQEKNKILNNFFEKKKKNRFQIIINRIIILFRIVKLFN